MHANGATEGVESEASSISRDYDDLGSDDGVQRLEGPALDIHILVN